MLSGQNETADSTCSRRHFVTCKLQRKPEECTIASCTQMCPRICPKALSRSNVIMFHSLNGSLLVKHPPILTGLLLLNLLHLASCNVCHQETFFFYKSTIFLIVYEAVRLSRVNNNLMNFIQEKLLGYTCIYFDTCIQNEFQECLN